jgi:hypothetical protein
MKHLSASEIAKSHQVRLEKRKECFDKILEICYKKIERVAKLNQSQFVYEVPEFVLGYPLFDINECIMHLYHKLTKNGFNAQYIFPRYLFISWALPKPIEMISYTAPQNMLYIDHHIEDNNDRKGCKAPTKRGAGRAKKSPQHVANTSAPFKSKGSVKTIVTTTSPPVATCPSAQRPVRESGGVFLKSISQFKPSGKFVLNLS